MNKTECVKCGVAFNVGYDSCVEPDCYKPRKKYVYPDKVIDPVYSRYSSVRYRANKRHMPFDLTQELVEHILNQPCEYCGDVGAIQLDRKVGELGYTADNVVPACRRCNMVKGMYLTHAEMCIVAKALSWKK